jgi:hypothetical protein
LVEETVSAFTRLLRNEENFRSWVEFTEKSDDEQERILHELDRRLLDNCFESTSFSADEAECKSKKFSNNLLFYWFGCGRVLCQNGISAFGQKIQDRSVKEEWRSIGNRNFMFNTNLSICRS